MLSTATNHLTTRMGTAKGKLSLQAKYVAIWKLSGANKLATDKPRLTLASSQEPQALATITADPAPDFVHIDRANALATQILKGVFTPEKGGSLEERLAAEIASISTSRAKKTEAGIYLVIEGNKDVPLPDFKARRDTLDFSVCLDVIDKKEIRASFRPFVYAALFALGLSHLPNADRQIEKIGEVVYLIDPESEKPIYTISMSIGNARLSLSSPLTEDVISVAGKRVPALMLGRAMGRSISLINTSFDRETNPLQAFIAAWSALEIFVNANFKDVYEARWFDVMESGAPVCGKPVFERFKDVMHDKYRLADKFLIIAAMLDPEAATADDQEFRRLKKIRDDLLHALASPDELPTEAVQGLLVKYMRAHLDRRG